MLKSKVILITGASSGIGAALAIAYSEEGVKLILLGRNIERLNKVAAECENKGASVITRVADVENKEEMEDLLITIDNETPIDLVFANAGISAGTSGVDGLHFENAAQVRKIFSVNVDGVFNTVLPLVERMRRRKTGQIAIISSLASIRALPSSPAYSASKAAVRYFGEATRALLKKDGIALTVIMPGYIKTPMTEKNEFFMPFLMSAEKCARIIKKKLPKNPTRLAFPFSLYIPLSIIAALPPSWNAFIFDRLPGKKPL